MARRKVRHTTATYREANGSLKCDLVELAKTYTVIGQIPERLNFSKACEIALLSEAFLTLYAARRKREGMK